MAVQQRQERGAGYQCFSSRLPVEVYNTLNDWAWERRMTLAKACSTLLSKAIAAEQGAAYTPEGPPAGKSCNV